MLTVATKALGTVLHNLRRSLLRQDEAGSTDGELLECFVTRRDEVAFEALLRRHGPMVLGVCRRVLCNEADAEDAFQATFFVLVRKAASIRPRAMVGNWLYGVAHSTALKARAMSTKRLAKEREAAARPKPNVHGETWQELQALLDQELKVLPDIYRAAIVLCDLEGKSIKEAAQQLGCPQGTVGTRLARGRILLSRRLARHGLTLSGGLIATVLAQNTATAGVPSLLMSSTIKAAPLIAAGQATAGGVISAKVAALTEGVIMNMFLSKIKGLMAALAIALVGLIAWGVGSPALTAIQVKPAAAKSAIAPGSDEKPSPKPSAKEEAAGSKGPAQGPEKKGKAIECSGQVTDAAGKPVPGVTVSVRWEAMSKTGQTQSVEVTKYQTDRDGKYRFTVPPEKSNRYVIVQVAHPDSVSRIFYEGVPSTKPPRDLDVRLDPGEAITGTVLTPDGKPAVGVRVVAVSRKAAAEKEDRKRETPTINNSFGFNTHARTDEKGRFRLKVVTPGPAVFWILPEKYAASEHRLNDKERGDVGTFTLKPGVSLTGKVLDVKGKPLAGVNVNASYLEKPERFLSLLGLGRQPRGRSAVTDAKGEFAMEALEPGDYLVMPGATTLRAGSLRTLGPFVEAGDEQKLYPVPDFFARKVVTLKDGAKAADVEIRAVPSVVVTIQFFDRDGKPKDPRNFLGFQLQGAFDKTPWHRIFEREGTGKFTARVPHGSENVQLNSPRGQAIEVGVGPLHYRLKKGDPLQLLVPQVQLGTVIDDMTIEIGPMPAKKEK